MESRNKISLRKKVAFSLASVLIFFTLLEISLKSWGIDPVLQTEDPFVGFSGSVPLYVNDTGTPGMMVTAANKRSHFNLQQFQRTKPANTFRIFCLGGSTTYGRPFDDATSFAGWLREFLPVADPKRSWEVLNAGGVSYASYRIVSLVEELIQYQPDLFVIYTGHNEFLESRSYPELANMSPWLLKSAATAGRFRTFALLRKLIATPAQAPSQQYQMPGEVDEILNHTIGPSSYQRDDAKRAQVAKHFEFNLIRMIQLARAGGAKVLIVSPASNLKDCAPFKSQHRDGLSTDEKQRFDALLKQAHANQAQEKLELALAQYKQAMAIDNRYADLHYQVAQLLLKKQQVTEALLASRRAQEEDICPLRAFESIRDSIQRVAADISAGHRSGCQINGDRTRHIIVGSGIGTITTNDHVIAAPSPDQVIAGTAIEPVSTTVSAQDIVRTCPHNIFNGGKRIGTRFRTSGSPRGQVDVDGCRRPIKGCRICPCSTCKQIITGATIENIVAATAA